jgi:hypothetical protein
LAERTCSLIYRKGFTEEPAMIDVPLRRIILSMPLVLIATLPAWGARTGGARATAQSFDGPWSVVIITDAGTCDRAYRYGVRIEGGRVIGEQGSAVAVSGRVDPRGRVLVDVRSGSSSAAGSGRLFGSTGSGRWQGVSANARCSGRWQAEREDSTSMR